MTLCKYNTSIETRFSNKGPGSHGETGKGKRNKRKYKAKENSYLRNK